MCWWATIDGTANARASKPLSSTMPCCAATHAAYLPLFPRLPLHYIARRSPQLLHSISPSFHVPPHPMAEKGIANARSRSNDPDVGGPQVLTCLFVLGLQGVEGWAEGREGEIEERREEREGCGKDDV